MERETDPDKLNKTKFRTRSSDQYKELKSFYSETNDKTMSIINKNPETKELFYSKELVPNILVTKSRPYRGGGCPETEYDKCYGKHLDNPKDKFFKTSKLPSGKEKPYADCLNISQGTNKASMNIQNYLGKFFFEFYF